MSDSLSLRLPFSFFFLAAVVTATAVGCGGRTEEPPAGRPETNAPQSGASGSAGSARSDAGSAPRACAAKACGVDCTPRGSDEPFNCNRAGECVVTGQPLECQACPDFLADCRQGDVPADLDGDGCLDGCKPISCPPFLPDCRQGDVPADLDGDGCLDGCKPVGSP
jgi:hypothetical protein